MRNKIVSILLVATLGMGCIACGDTKADTNSTTSNNQTTSKETGNETTIESESSIDESLFKYDELEDGNISVWDYEGEVENLVIPETIDGKTVVEIGETGFANNSVFKSVVIPDTVKEIKKYAFSNTSLESVTIGNGVEIIGYNAFSGTSLKEITIPASVNTIAEGAFSHLSVLSKVVFLGDVENMEIAFVNNAKDVTFYGPANSNVQTVTESLGRTYVVQ